MDTISYPNHIVDRFWGRVLRGSSADCWEWQGAVSNNGYGHLIVCTKTVSAHRFSYEIMYGDIPAGCQICHSCDNRKCVNPAHLFAGTRQANMNDMLAKQRQSHGDRHPNALYSNELVARIRGRWDAGGVSKRGLAREFGISNSHMCAILNRARRRVK
jgi:hypothetical protein